jgi:hypothetical protein
MKEIILNCPHCDFENITEDPFDNDDYTAYYARGHYAVLSYGCEKCGEIFAFDITTATWKENFWEPRR